MLQIKITHLCLVLMLLLCKTSNFSICKNCCDCCTESEETNINEKIDINEEDEKIKDAIMRHLKLDEKKLNGIKEELGKIKDQKEKFIKIIQYVMDIDWENPMYPNTLIQWGENKCEYIAYFHLRLNNPYFLKFFLICDQINENKKTVLYEVCQLIKQCINLPNFQKSKSQDPGVTVDKIMERFYKDEKYKEIKKKPLQNNPIQYNLALKPTYIKMALEQDIDSLFEFVENDSPFICGSPTFDKYILKLEQIAIKLEDNKNISSLIKREKDSLLGIRVIDLSSNHTYAIVKNKKKWFLKDSLEKDKGWEMTVDDVVNLCNKNLDKYKNSKNPTLFFYKLNKCENLESFLKDLEKNIPSKSL